MIGVVWMKLLLAAAETSGGKVEGGAKGPCAANGKVPLQSTAKEPRVGFSGTES